MDITGKRYNVTQKIFLELNLSYKREVSCFMESFLFCWTVYELLRFCLTHIVKTIEGVENGEYFGVSLTSSDYHSDMSSDHSPRGRSMSRHDISSIIRNERDDIIKRHVSVDRGKQDRTRHTQAVVIHDYKRKHYTEVCYFKINYWGLINFSYLDKFE